MESYASNMERAAYKRFRGVALLVKAVMIMMKEPNKRHNKLSNIASYVTFKEYMQHVKEESQSSIIDFDVSLYKANQQLRITRDTKRILFLPQEERAPHIEKALLMLRSIKAFSEYPKRMQRKLIEVCWYESHCRKKIIVRQGHQPRAFYFILSGRVSVKVLPKNEAFARTVCYLDRGKSFGELAIIHGTVRQATVITEETVELLCIDKADFKKIFMTSPEGKNMHDPDFLTFVKELHFMDGWPIEILNREKNDCLFFYFKSGEVLVKDSKYSSWLYVIKSGSCDVLKKLRKVRPKSSSIKKEIEPSYRLIQREMANRRTPVQKGTPAENFPVKLPIQRQQENNFIVTKLDIKAKRNPRDSHIMQSVSQRITVLDCNADRPQHTTKTAERDVCFVRITTLQRGETFGLQEILHCDQPSLILVSNGAEILMISKKLYEQHINNETILQMQRTTPVYPQDDVLQRELETAVYWSAFKKQQIHALFGDHRVTENRIKARRCRTAHF